MPMSDVRETKLVQVNLHVCRTDLQQLATRFCLCKFLAGNVTCSIWCKKPAIMRLTNLMQVYCTSFLYVCHRHYTSSHSKGTTNTNSISPTSSINEQHSCSCHTKLPQYSTWEKHRTIIYIHSRGPGPRRRSSRWNPVAQNLAWSETLQYPYHDQKGLSQRSPVRDIIITINC